MWLFLTWFGWDDSSSLPVQETCDDELEDMEIVSNASDEASPRVFHVSFGHVPRSSKAYRLAGDLKLVPGTR